MTMTTSTTISVTNTRRARRRRSQVIALATPLLLILGTTGCNVLGASSPSGRRGVIIVMYNPSNIHNSKMYLTQGGVTQDHFRTGAGTGPIDPCNNWTGTGDPNGAGPAPTGQYNMLDALYHTHNKGWGDIFGRTWRANDTHCAGGTPRTLLYIHTEETPSRTQGTAENQRWDGTSDYRSYGCWKVARSNNGGDNGVTRLDNWWHAMGGKTDTPYTNYLTVAWSGF